MTKSHDAGRALAACPLCEAMPKRNGRGGTGGVLCAGDNATVGMVHRFQTYGADQQEADDAWNRFSTRPPAQAGAPSGGLADEWYDLSARADQNTGDQGEDMASIGLRDGYSGAVQTLDMLTGGDGEYCYCTIPSDSHCPDPPAMIRRIVARLSTPAASGDTPLAGQETADSEKLREVISELAAYTSHHIGCAIYQQSWVSGAPRCSCGLDTVRAALTAAIAFQQQADQKEPTS